MSSDDKYHSLNDAICVIAGEVRAAPASPSTPIEQLEAQLVFAVSELVWEPPPD
jgi:hypothetical protein